MAEADAGTVRMWVESGVIFLVVIALTLYFAFRNQNRGFKESKNLLVDLVNQGEFKATSEDELEPFEMNNPDEVKNAILKKEYRDYTLYLVDAIVQVWQENCSLPSFTLPVTQVIVKAETPGMNNLVVTRRYEPKPGFFSSTKSDVQCVEKLTGGANTRIWFGFSKKYQQIKAQKIFAPGSSNEYNVYSELPCPDESWMNLLETLEQAQNNLPDMEKPRALVLTENYLLLTYDRITEKSHMTHLITIGKFLSDRRNEWKEQIKK